MSATPLTAEVLAALRRIGCPVTTTDLMRLLNHGRATPLISDQVYRAADALRARGSVRSLKTKANRRVRYWEYIAEPPACTCRTKDTS
jgi:Fe2+ or Zn2+ uptake regulation protein